MALPIARVKQSPAASSNAWNANGSGAPRSPVAKVNTVSPSNMVCTGRMARAMPSWAMPDTLAHCALVRFASVATTPMVVANADRARPGMATVSAAARAAATSSASGSRRAVNSPGSPNRAAYSSPVRGSTQEPEELTTTSTATVVPSASTTLAEPTAPLSPPAVAPVPAPTIPIGTEPAGPEVAAAAEVEDDGAGHDRDDLTRPARRIADPGPEEPLHHAVGGRKPERAPTRQRYGVDLFDHVARVQDVGLAGARSTPANVNPSNGTTLRREDHRGAGQPPVAATPGMPHPDTCHVGQAVSRPGLEDGHRCSHDRPRSRGRSILTDLA